MKPAFILSVLIAVSCVVLYQKVSKSKQIPSHLQGHAVKQVPDLITEEERLTLISYIKKIAHFPTNLADTSFYKTKREHIGEAVPFVDGECPNHLLIPNSDRTECVLPGRIDVGRHFLTFGGFEGMKEKAEKSISRLLPFMHYAFDLKKYPLMEKLFASEYFINSAKDVCPPDQQYLDPFQVNFILQIPSQSVALHVDGVYFWGADRFLYPQWLLAVMKFSGLFEEQFISQIQVVAYLHEWDDPSREGMFVHFNNKNGKPTRIPPTPRFGSVIDGSKVVHAATIYKGKEGSTAPTLAKDKPNMLQYVGRDNWEVFDGEKVVANYTTDDLRISLVFRARCFANEEEAKENQRMRDNHEGLSQEFVLETLKKDMRDNKNINIPEDISAMDLALLLLDTYIAYPKPETWMPFNYCMVSKVVPSLSPLVDLLC